jgi:hypothetical protein
VELKVVRGWSKDVFCFDSTLLQREREGKGEREKERGVRSLSGESAL